MIHIYDLIFFNKLLPSLFDYFTKVLPVSTGILFCMLNKTLKLFRFFCKVTNL